MSLHSLVDKVIRMSAGVRGSQFAGCMALALGASFALGQTKSESIDLPSSKQIVRPVPGRPQKLNGLPMSLAISPRWPLCGDSERGVWHIRVEV